jgi:hypothetical protein
MNMKKRERREGEKKKSHESDKKHGMTKTGGARYSEWV